MSNPLYLANVREKFQKFLAAGKTVDHNAFSDSLCMGSSLIKANMPARPCNQTAVVQYRSSRVQRHTRHIIGHFGDNLHSQSLDGAKKPVFLTNQLADSSTTIDNRIYNSRLNTSYQLRRRKCHQFSRDKKWQTRRKSGCYWAEEYATSQLHKRK